MRPLFFTSICTAIALSASVAANTGNMSLPRAFCPSWPKWEDGGWQQVKVGIGENRYSLQSGFYIVRVSGQSPQRIALVP